MKKIKINENWCKKCGICAAYCKFSVFGYEKDSVPAVAHIENCTACRLCESRCPDFAITVEVNEE